MAAKKTAAKKTSASEVSTVSTDEGPAISPELVEARDAARKREVDSGVKDASGALLVSYPEPLIDEGTAKARDEALKAEKK